MKYQKVFLASVTKKSCDLVLVSFGILFSIQVLYSQDVKNTADLQLNGKIKKVTIKEHSANEELGDIEPTEMLSKNIYHFYDNGKIKKRIFTMDEGEQTEITQNYSEDGYLISTYVSKEHYSSIIIDSVIYNAYKAIDKRVITVVELNEKKVKESEYIERVFYYDYNEKGDLISIKNTLLTENGYDPITFSCLLCTEKSRINLQIIQSYVSHNMTQIDQIWNESSNMPENDGNMKLEKKFSKEIVSKPQLAQEIKIKYFYDERNNWIKSIVLLGSQNSPYIIKTRDISYY
jgi:hypothetical protein